jgi:chromosome segregation ATPase
VDVAKKKAELDEKVEALEEEKACLIAEIETLKAISEQEVKVSTLEGDIAKLREEKKTLEEKVTPPPCEEPAAEPASAETPAEAPTTEAPAPAEEKSSEACEEKPCE